MNRKLKQGDTVFTPCKNSASAHLRLEEQRVDEIGDDYIILTHVATIRRSGDEVVREVCEPTEHRGSKDELDYYSRPLEDIISEFQQQNEWLCNRLIADAEKYKKSEQGACTQPSVAKAPSGE
jgi:hypothetical protein